jgi:hypothetical protein
MQRVGATLIAALIVAVSPTPDLYAQQKDTVEVFLRRVEQILQRGDARAYLALHAESANRTRASEFAGSELLPHATHAVVQERDRQPLPGTLPGNGYRLMVDTFADFGASGRIATWRLDIKRSGSSGADDEWVIAEEEKISSVENLYRLGLNPSKQYAARGLRISAEDIDLTLAEGSVFVSDIEIGITGVVLLGRGTLNFHPTPNTEKGQVKIFCGSEALDAAFTAAFIRVNPGDFESFVGMAGLWPVAVDPRELKRAQELFQNESTKSFVIDLGDLSRDSWSLLPGVGDFVAEIRTKKYDTLTYARSSSEAEDITLFDRKRKHNISIYASKDKLSRRGRFYNEDELVDYDVLDYDVDVTAMPDRHWLDGHAIMRLKVRSYGLATLSLRLADPLVVSSIVSREYGRLFGIRVRNQNLLVISLPTFVPRDTQITLTINYAGRLEPQAPDRETIEAGQIAEDLPIMAAEKSFLYSNRSYWYPQASVSDYATAKLRLTVPNGIDCVASGELEPGYPIPIEPGGGYPARKQYVFSASQPLRYLSFIMSRFTRAETATVAFPARDVRLKPDAGAGAGPIGNGATSSGISYRSLNLSVESNPRQVQRGRDLAERAGDIAQFYNSIIGDCPYSGFTLALIESDLPGGHSPGYFVALNQPLPMSPLVWRNDPVAFPGFTDFFIAHEIAHQWWGQAVGWRNYHEQWLSEGFAQYFAALYAQHQRGDDMFESVLKQMRKTAMDKSDQGPVYLGYRLGHIRDESRVFRALVYNKGAAVLHMLRRLVGDEPFFRGLQRFYTSSRFKKVGTEEFRVSMETETGRKLDRFFERWIYGSTLPKLRFTHRVEGSDLLVHVEQVGAEIFDVPLPLTLQYADRKPVDVVVAVTDRAVDQRIPLVGTLRGVEFNKGDGTLAEVVK